MKIKTGFLFIETHCMLLWNQVDALQKQLKKKRSCTYAPLDEVLGYNISSELKETEQKRKVIMNFYTGQLVYRVML